MTAPLAPSRTKCSPVEFLLLGMVLAGLVHLVLQFREFGYLPQPFVWDPADTFMDWFNTAYWAHREGIYSVWQSVYPPLSFVVLKIFTWPSCYVSSSFAARSCDLLGNLAIFSSYVLAMVVSYLALRIVQPANAVVRTPALALGLPGLYLLERGNLLILCQLCLAIVVVPGMGGRWSKALAAATMINLKPYMLLAALAWGVRREWRMLELAGFATVAMFCATWAIIGAGSPLEILTNMVNWARVTGMDFVFEAYYTTSFHNMFGVIDRGFPILRFVGSRQYEQFRLVIEAGMLLSQATAIGALGLAFLRPGIQPQARIALILLLLTLTSRSPGGYTEWLVVLLVFLEDWRRIGPIVAIVTAYLISIPYEWIVSYLPTVNSWSWISGHAVSARFGIGIGQFLRPIGLLLILFALSLDSIAQITRSLRSEHAVCNTQARPESV